MDTNEKIEALTQSQLVLGEVLREVERQEEKWGEQNHPDGTSEEKFGWMADLAKLNCNKLHQENKITWAAVLFEEFYEALAEGAADALRTELVQVAAVAVSWVKAIDRKERARRQLSDS
jgi:hypothetical protein